jgi:hypothetical protein
MDQWSFYQVVAYDRDGQEVYYDRPPSFGKFVLLLLHACWRVSRGGYRTRFKAGSFRLCLRCDKLPWRPW